jgi:F0F1-type ATP synthase membrane subunit b/b'
VACAVGAILSQRGLPDVVAASARPAEFSAERAMADLRSRVAELSIELAEKVVERNLDRDTQMNLIENYINQVSTS